VDRAESAFEPGRGVIALGEHSTMAENPFYNRGPIRDPGFFFDRQTEVGRALELLRHGQSVSVICQRRIGKTSFLVYASLPETLRQYGLVPEEHLFAFVDCQELGFQEQSGTYADIIEAIEEELPAVVRDSLPEVFEQRSGSYQMLRWLAKQLYRSGLQVIVMLDEFEYMTQNQSLDSSFFSSLRSLAGNYNVAFVTTTRVPLMRLKYARTTDIGSPFFNFFFPLQLGLFELGSSEDMVRALVERGMVRLDEMVVDWVVQVGGNHPFLTQVAGYWAWELWREKGKLDSHYMKRLRSAVYEDMEGHFLYCWHHLTQKEQETLASLPSESRTPAVERLIQIGLVVEEERYYRPFSPLFATFVNRQPLPNVLRAGPLRFDLHQRQVYVDDCPVDLSPSQYVALRFMIERPGRLAPYEELEQEIWPGELYQGPERIKGLISKLRTALGPAGEYIENRRGFGYVLILPEHQVSGVTLA
jgi:hypothetical protein